MTLTSATKASRRSNNKRATAAPEMLNGGADKSAASANTMWGGRFSGGPSAIMDRINPSIDFDKKMYRQDIQGSIAHAEMLAATGIIPRADAKAIVQGLRQVEAEIDTGKFAFKRSLEDIHFNVESRLTELIGPSGGRVHTARSRNDQVATDLRLWVRDAIDEIDQALARLQATLIDRAEEHADTILPGFTHLQPAQPVTFGHHLLAYVEMFGRDRGRFADARRRMNESPLGSGALAGTSFPIDRHMTARALGFDRPCANSLDGVSDRDFAVEYLAAGALCAVHLSRLGEEIVLWMSDQFRYIRLSDAFTTGSSIMPQKRNPDAAELTRGKSGRVIGALTGLLVMLKGLPLSFNKDQQEDKEPVFDATDTLLVCLAAASGMIADLKVDKDAMRRATSGGFMTATDLADWLVRVAGMPFRQAHHAAGRIVKLAETRAVGLSDLTLDEMQAAEPSVTKDIFKVLRVDSAVTTRTSYGGTAPANVRRACKAARRRFLEGKRA